MFKFCFCSCVYGWYPTSTFFPVSFFLLPSVVTTGTLVTGFSTVGSLTGVFVLGGVGVVTLTWGWTLIVGVVLTIFLGNWLIVGLLTGFTSFLTSGLGRFVTGFDSVLITGIEVLTSGTLTFICSWWTGCSLITSLLPELVGEVTTFPPYDYTAH